MPSTPVQERDYAPAARRLVTTALVLGVLATLAYWSLHQPFMAYTRTLWEISRLPPPRSLPMPVENVAVAQVADSWGAARGTDRSHEGVDIFASRGTAVLSATRGVVSSVRESGLGGKQVWIVGPGMERHYYAHLDDWAEDLLERQVVQAGDVIGYVGTTGNARGTPPHLHYGIYGAKGAIDPLPRLKATAEPSPDLL